MLKRIVCLVLIVVCLLPALALAASYDSTKVYNGDIDTNSIVFKAGDRFTTGSRITVELYYADASGNVIAQDNGTVKSVTIDGEKVSEWRLTQRSGAVIQAGNMIYQATYGFTLQPTYAVADSEGYYTLQSNTYHLYEKNASNKKVRFTGTVISKAEDMPFVSIAENAIVAIQSDAAFEIGDRLVCKGTIADYLEYHGASVPVIACDEAKVQQYDPLQKGDKGAEVVQMKERLQALGYFRAGAELSDTYNDTCVERVQQFQQNNGLSATGIADADTLTLLYSDAAKGK